MATVTTQSLLFDQAWQTDNDWRLTPAPPPRRRTKPNAPLRPRMAPSLTAPPIQRQENAERWDGLA